MSRLCVNYKTLKMLKKICNIITDQQQSTNNKLTSDNNMCVLV